MFFFCFFFSFFSKGQLRKMGCCVWKESLGLGLTSNNGCCVVRQMGGNRGRFRNV